LLLDYASCHAGSSVEFQDYQSFTSGENIRHIDWNRYQKDGTLFVRQYECQEKPQCIVVIDLSRSVIAGGKAEAVRRFAAAVCFCLLNRGVEIKLYADNLIQLYSGKTGWFRMHEHIEHLNQGQRKSLDVNGISSVSQPVIIISDLIFSGGIRQFKQALHLLPTGMCSLFNLSSEADRNPGLRGDYRLTDSQDDSKRITFIDDRVVQKYKQIRQAYYRDIEGHCLRMHWQYRDVYTEQPIRKQLESVLSKGVLLL
jgi:uncharacterized protein (DUF58 family)